MAPTTKEFLRCFSRIGLLSFGGPAAQISLMHKELVEDRAWMREEDYLRALSFCMLLPGPEAMQLATYAGWRIRGYSGGLTAGLLFVLPGACVISGLVWLYVSYGNIPAVQAAFLGVKAGVIIIVAQALWKIGKKALSARGYWLISFLSFMALFTLNLPFPLVIALAAMMGYCHTRFSSQTTGKISPTITATSSRTTSLTAPAPIRPILICLIAWLLPLWGLSLIGADFLATLGWFFAKLAVVSFGGAYAVLTYVTQTVVTDHGWIDTRQMIDALGLAETTPGPLVLVVQFVAMLAGMQIGTAATALAAGAVALWATFAPCFLWIFAAAPYLDRLTTQPQLQGALKAITAAVSGMMANLSLWFTLHLLFHEITFYTSGPIRLIAPDVTSVNIAAFLLVGFAPVAYFFTKGRLIVMLSLMAGAGLALETVLSV